MKLFSFFNKPKSLQETAPKYDPETNSSISVLNRWFEEIFAARIKFFNDSSLIKCEKEIGNVYNLPIAEIEGDGFTITDDKSGAFLLNEPAYFKVRKADSKMLVYCVRVSYETGARWLNDRALFEKEMNLLVNNSTSKIFDKIQEVFGKHDFYFGHTFISAKSPGSKGLYINENTHRAGYEIRFFTDLALVNPPKSPEPVLDNPTPVNEVSNAKTETISEKRPILSKNNRRRRRS